MESDRVYSDVFSSAMMNSITIALSVESGEARTEYAELQNLADKVAKDVMASKRKVLAEIQETQRSAVRMMSGVRQLFYAFGGSLDPFMQAIFNIVGSSIEMLYAIATAEGSTVVGIPAAAIHAGIAIAIEAVTLPQILAGVHDAQTSANRALAAVDALAIFGGL